MKHWKRKAILLAVIVLGALFCWQFVPPNQATTDEEKDKEMEWYNSRMLQVHSAKANLPQRAAIFLRLGKLEDRFYTESERRLYQMLDSGYYTNATINITNMPADAATDFANLTEVMRRLRVTNAPAGTIRYNATSNQLTIICRTKDLPLYTHLVQTP